MHFYEKPIIIKVILFIEFFQKVVPKFGSDVFFGSYRTQTRIFYSRFKIRVKFYVRVRIFFYLKIESYINPHGLDYFSKKLGREGVHKALILNLEITYSNVKFSVYYESGIENMIFAPKNLVWAP